MHEYFVVASLDSLYSSREIKMRSIKDVKYTVRFHYTAPLIQHTQHDERRDPNIQFQFGIFLQRQSLTFH